MVTPTVGVLALQGDVREHLQVLSQLDCNAIEVRTPEQLNQVESLVIPGGESTTIYKLSKIFGMLEPVRAAIHGGLPVLGTCAGLILLAREILDPSSGQESFGGLDVSVRRNAFGNQNDSFETQITFAGLDEPVKAAFIRAPIVESISGDTEILSTLPSGQIVAVRQNKVIGLSFHPEMFGDARIHQMLIDSI